MAQTDDTISFFHSGSVSHMVQTTQKPECQGSHHPDRRLLAQGGALPTRDEYDEAITEAKGKAACADRFKIDPKVRAARRRNTPAKVLKNRAGRGRKESAQKVAPAIDPPEEEASENVA